MRAPVDRTANTVRDGFPHFTDPATGRWTLTPNGDRSGGYWNAMLWLSAHAPTPSATLARLSCLFTRCHIAQIARASPALALGDAGLCQGRAWPLQLRNNSASTFSAIMIVPVARTGGSRSHNLARQAIAATRNSTHSRSYSSRAAKCVGRNGHITSIIGY
jgi:hypothetical protein